MTQAPSLTVFERRETDVVMRWNDGSENTMTYEDMRFWCPCANCKPRRENNSRKEVLKDEISRLRNEKPKAEMVGGYGLKFTFKSGCNSGIYSIERLYAIVTNNLDPDEI
jgi:DUF971 family protein